jgi:Bacterial PH domain
MDNKTNLVYPTAISWWLWIPIYTLIIGQGIFLMSETSVWFFLFHLTLAILIYIFIVRIQYILTTDQIIIKMGPFSYRKIDIVSIRKMQLSNNPLSSPAASLRRIAIHYNQWGFVLISPKNREEFIEEVEKRKQALVAQNQP